MKVFSLYKFMVPVAAAGVTVAVNATSSPITGLDGDDCNVTVEGVSPVTKSETMFDSAVSHAEFALKLAVSNCCPAVENVAVSVAVPELMFPVPIAVEPL